MITDPFSWPEMKAAVDALFGTNALRLSTDEKQALVAVAKTLVAVIKKADENTVMIHFRASMFPNTAAKISVAVAQHANITLGDVFEFDDNNDWLFGTDALDYVSDKVANKGRLLPKESDKGKRKIH